MRKTYNMTMKTKIVSLIGALVFIIVTAVSAVYYYQGKLENTTILVNISASQRVLSQKIAFLSTSIATGDTKSQEELRKTTLLFEKSLATLRNGDDQLPTTSKSIQKLVQKCEQAWQKYKLNAAYLMTHSIKNNKFYDALGFIEDHNDLLLKQSHAVVLAYVNDVNAKNYPQEIKRAGKQQMLSQKIARHAAMLSIHGKEKDRSALLQALQSFNNNLNDLRMGTGSLQQAPLSVIPHLETLKQSWKNFYKKALFLQQSSPINNKTKQTLDALKEQAPQILAISSQISTSLSEEGVNKINDMKLFLLVMLPLAGAMGLTGYLLAQNIAKPLTKVALFAKEIARGNLVVKDLVVKEHDNQRDEVALMSQSLNHMKHELATLVNQIIASSSNISNKAEQLFTVSQEDTNNSLESAESIEATTATLEKLTATMKLSSKNAIEANSIAQNSVTIGRESEQVIQETIASMAQVTAASHKIANITEVVSEISFQTNLLALNAAVEAARAGEQGRGFAVVAGEVRTLAGRSSAAVQEIKALILDSQDKVTIGNRLVDKTGKKLHDIIVEIGNLAEIIAKITASSQEQSSGIEEINKAMDQLDRLVQIKMVMIEESTATAENLTLEAGDLQKMASHFQTSQ